MDHPLFSIITVTLNPGASLGTTIESVKGQTYRGFEHIIKDAGSSDGSIERYVQADGDYQPRLVCQRDRGIYDAMNQALDYATGDYVLFLNAGDLLFDRDVLEQVAGVVRQRPGIGLAYGDYFSGPLDLAIKSPRRLTNFFLFRNTLCHQSCFALRDEIEKLGRFDTSLRVLADYDLLLRMVLRTGVPYHYIEKTLASCMGGGFSARPDNARIALQEARLLRRRHFNPMDRLWYGCVRAATLPQLRIRLMASTRLLPLQRMYARAVNLWNKRAAE